MTRPRVLYRPQNGLSPDDLDATFTPFSTHVETPNARASFVESRSLSGESMSVCNLGYIQL
jgi:hypothetical protein